MDSINTKKVIIVLLEDFLASGLSGAMDLLNTANLVHKYMHKYAPKLFVWEVVSLDSQSVIASNGYSHPVEKLIEQVTSADVIYIPGVSLISEKAISNSLLKNQALYPWLKKQALNNCIITSSCTGSLFLAEAGLLKNKKVTTSWMFSGYFSRHYPDITLLDDEILVDEKSIITSAAASSYQELILTIIGRFAGKELALLVSKYMLIDTNRSSQAAFKVALPSTFDIEDELVTNAVELIRVNLHKSFTINQLAEQLHVSYRTLIRRFQAALSLNIKTYIQNQRVESAKQLFELTQLSVDEIVYKVGYNDVSAFRKLFKKTTNMTPQLYKQKFGVV
ncbi:MAG: helix-turn-helix domain-containing protein [Alcanivoracaceae bacterium]|nr:helix-turn-helix domain-containing protein [Alcanivoracaceae bacterium]